MTTFSFHDQLARMPAAMAARIARHDWSASPQGSLDAWPQPLKTVVGMMLGYDRAMFVAWGPQGSLLYNDACAAMLGAPQGEVLGRDGRDLWPALAPVLARVFAGEPAPRHPIGAVGAAPDALSCTPVHDEAGGVAGIVCTLTTPDDGARESLPEGTRGRAWAETRETAGAPLHPTERDWMGERLRQSEARYRTLFDSIESGFCIVEVRLDAADGRIDYRVIEANPAFHSQTGFPDAVIGRWLRDAVPALEEEWYDIYGRVARTGTPERFEQGSLALGRWFDVSAFRIGEAEERRVAILFNDISARRNAEERLRSLNETLEAQVADRTAERDRMWRLSTDIMLVARFDATIIAVNPAWTSLLGWQEQALIGHSFLDLVHPDDRQSTVAAATALSEGTTIGRFENRYRASDGRYHWLSWTAVPGADLIHAVGRDVSIERERQAELEEAQEQLRQAQKMEAVGQLTGGIAHDFNNLLTGVIGSLDMMQRRIARGEIDRIERYATTAMTSANRAAALTHRLLAFSRRQPLDPKPVNANRLVTGMEELLRRTIGEGIRLEIVTAGGLWQTLCDPHQLESGILNLAINARDAMPEGGILTIETCNAQLDSAYAARQRDVRPGQYVCICVTDTGTGMTRETIERAFEPFFTTKPIGQGTGLGLSMIYGFARQSEGYARIYSEVGQGTTIKLYLPRHQGDVDHEVAEDGGLTVAHRAAHGEVVLVVEDETAVRDLVVDVLEELGYRAIEANDGPSGLALLQSNIRIDLLVTDDGLPGLNGRQLADAARQQRPALKVLFMTGYAENAAVANGFLDPGMEMITKPFAIDALATRIRDIVEADR